MADARDLACRGYLVGLRLDRDPETAIRAVSEQWCRSVGIVV